MSDKRSLFVDVGSDQKREAAQKGGIDRSGGTSRIVTARWVLALVVLIIIMIVVGGLTRLTDSGLSITQWDPVMGAIPPLSAADWQKAFAAYQTSYEFQTQNAAMSLAQFKVIFWWEWGHRQLGRFIGLFWGGGFVLLWATAKLPTQGRAQLFWVGPFIAVQGVIGWLMVASGFQGTRTDVASYWLMTHLGAAFALLGYLYWQYMGLCRSEGDLLTARRQHERPAYRLAVTLAVLLYVQILLGALVAGLDAGRNYTDWPLMAGHFFPPFMFEFEPWWRNFFENDGLVQFIHRIWAYALFAFALYAGVRAAKSPYSVVRKAFSRFGLLLIAQMLLGIITVMYAAPWYFAILHQLLAIFLWFAVLHAIFVTAFPVADRLRGR